MRFVLVISLVCAACGAPEDDYEMDGPFTTTPPLGKEDNAGRAGLLVATDTRATQVWTATRKWEDIDPETGLNWDQAYAAWIASMPRSGNTFQLTTPFGRTLPAPSLECAENSIFLRALFASWHQLPFFMEAVDAHGRRVYFGHFGVRTAAGRYAATPLFASAYRDYSSTWQPGQPWPHDTTLRSRGIAGGSDEQPALAAGARFGVYLDEALLNKRAASLIILLLDNFGSMNLADSANTFNLRPDAVREGDSLLERWQKTGIGHTLVVKAVGHNSAGALTAELMSGSMPRRQPVWEDEVGSKEYFTSEYTGGMGTAWDGNPLWKLGGGLKRWRVTKNVRGYWTNTFMAGDEASWINDQDEQGISSRPQQFQSLLGEVSPQEKRDALLRIIGDARQHLRDYPASCAARDRREGAFAELYDLSWRLGLSQEEIDRQYRALEDYVFAPLVYNQAKTCCWDSTNSNMGQIVLDYAAQEQSAMCVTPTVFRSESTGYDRWRNFAASTGRAWKDWSEDEPCAQRAVAPDVLADFAAGSFCH